jgi:hypothetical protein
MFLLARISITDNRIWNPSLTSQDCIISSFRFPKYSNLISLHALRNGGPHIFFFFFFFFCKLTWILWPTFLSPQKLSLADLHYSIIWKYIFQRLHQVDELSFFHIRTYSAQNRNKCGATGDWIIDTIEKLGESVLSLISFGVNLLNAETNTQPW